MKKPIFLLILIATTSTLWACSSSVADHNGKSCPKGSESKTACNRTPPTR